MDPKPILIFPTPLKQERTKKRQFPPSFNLPPKKKQVGKFDGLLTNLSLVLQNQTAQLFPSIKGLSPEMILVFEIAGTIDEFFKAIEKTSGMEYLTQYKSEFEPDMDFFYPDEKERRIESRIFLTMSNQQGLEELLRYWRSWKNDKKLERGVGRFQYLFNQLKDIRPYNVNDRFRDTGFEFYLQELTSLKVSNVNFEIEFAYTSSSTKQKFITREIQRIIEQDGGKIIDSSETIIPEINYHGIIASAPISSFRDLTENTNITFLKFNWILYFRPVGQTVTHIDTATLSVSNVFSQDKSTPIIEKPSVAVLDGLPLNNHFLISDRVIIDDPDNYSDKYLSQNRIHGTLMTSLILHGDLNDNEPPLDRKIYVRPVMKLYQGFSNPEERMPDNFLAIDIIHRAIKRIVESSDLNSIRIINLSICDPYQPFLKNVSTFAKLLDWLAHKYDILFLISSGNYVEDIEIDLSKADFIKLSSKEKQELIIKALHKSQFDRKILSPAESVNSLTIGAIYDDSSTIVNIGNRVEPYNINTLPSSISRIGYGINKALKPDILLKGGRTLYRIKLNGTSLSKTKLSVISNNFSVSPGNLTAFPGSAGQINAIGYSSGTSNATALATRQAARLYEVLEEINQGNDHILIPQNYYSVLIKTLLTHYSSSTPLMNSLEKDLKSIASLPDNLLKAYLYQCIGYGALNVFKLGFCTEYRVTLLGYGELMKDNAHVYSFPLPNSISGKQINKILTISLGWFSPLNFKSGKYRQAALSFDNVKANEDIEFGRIGSDLHHSKRGTLQHDILQGHHADAYIYDTNLAIKVNCRELAGGLGKLRTKYAIVVTLEVDEKYEIPIYEEIKSRITQQIQITTH